MTERATLVDTVASASVNQRPFPHVVVKDALPLDYYAALSEAFPKLEDLPPSRASANNKRVDLLSSWGPALLPNESIPQVWRTFIADHCSEDFRQKVFDLFPFATMVGEKSKAREIRVECFGDGLIERLAVSEPIFESDISCRATLGVNTPVRVATSVRGPHVDSPQKAYVGLYYLREVGDDSEGGDLTIHRVRPGCSVEPWAKSVDPDAVEEVEIIKYAPNTLVLMLNTREALHGVTIRKPTLHMRRLVVVSGWFPGEGRESFARNKFGAAKSDGVGDKEADY